MNIPVISTYTLTNPNVISVLYPNGDTYEYLNNNIMMSRKVIYMEKKGSKKWLSLLKSISFQTLKKEKEKEKEKEKDKEE